MATIQWRRHRRKDGTFTKAAYLNWSEAGRQCRKSLGKITPDKAEDVRLAKQLELRTGEQILSYAPLFGELVDDYLNWRASEYPDSQERIKQLVEQHLKPVFQYFAIDAIRPRQVEQYKADRRQEVAEATVAKEVLTLKAMLNKFVEWQLINFSPIQLVKPPEIRTSRPIHWYQMEELQQIYSNAGARGPIWQFMANTGIRRGEARNLTMAHDRGESILIESTPEARTKSRRYREIPLSVNAREALDQLIKQSRTDYILPVMTPHSLTRAFARDKGDLDGSLHSLRHTFGSHLAIKGTPVKVLQELMGHASIKTTQKYLHVAQTHLAEAIDGFSI